MNLDKIKQELKNQNKFRGKSLESGELVYGSLGYYGLNPYILVGDIMPNIHRLDKEWHMLKAVPVDPNSIGQYTGLNDTNGAEIYSGNFLESEDGEISGVVSFSYGSFELIVYPEMIAIPLHDLERKYNFAETPEDTPYEERARLDSELKHYKITDKIL